MLGVIAVAALLAMAPFILGTIVACAAAAAIAAGIYYLVTALSDVYAQAKAFAAGWLDIGSAIVGGIVDGIKAGAGAVLGAITGVARGAIDGVKGILGIHSPSKVFAELGLHTTAGFAEGLDKGSGDVADATQAMVSIPTASAGGDAGAGGAAKGGGAATFNITINGVKGAEQLKEPGFLAQLSAALQGAATSMGAPVEAGAT